ncbi:hypothetical protein BDV19DRAFT_387146 [Aspergillus venezuelensis]
MSTVKLSKKKTPLKKLLPIRFDLAEFQTAWYNQQMVLQLQQHGEDTESNIDFSPTPLKKVSQEPPKFYIPPPANTAQTPTRRNIISQLRGTHIDESNSVKETPQIQETLQVGENELADDDDEFDIGQMPQTGESGNDRKSDVDYEPGMNSDDEQEKDAFPKFSDESLVNTVYIGLASTLSIKVKGVKCHWSQTRKGFKVKTSDGTKVYEARTDGHLFHPSNHHNSCVIVEVKPIARGNCPRVRMQETAQMAAWIHCEPDILDGTPNQRFQRLLISQNWDAIYFIIAEYNADYVDFMTNEKRTEECKSCLKLNEFGPFYINKREDVERLAAIILAVTLLFSRGGNLNPPAGA